MSADARNEIVKSATTAKEFFLIVFNAEQYGGRKEELEQILDHDDIETNSFFIKCADYARERLASIGAGGGLQQCNAVPDEELDDLRERLASVWPLVKSLQLEAGHRLLRNNLCFLDLPGEETDCLIPMGMTHEHRIW